MTRQRLILIAGLIFLFSWTAGCQRIGTDEGSPLGPSTFALTFQLEARPNILLATAKRPVSIIRTEVTQSGKPVAGQTVYFTLLSGPGEFGDFTRRTAATTNADGIAAVMFIGPTKFEIDADADATIEARLETSTPDVILKHVTLRILLSQ